MKQLWITSLGKDQAAVSQLLATAQRYGLKADGHFWVNDLPKMAWQAPLERLADPAVSLWVILGRREDLTPDIGYGLSLLFLSAVAARGNAPAILWLDAEGKLGADQLPTLFGGATVLSPADASIGAKMVARANLPPTSLAGPYRLAVHANPGYGVWFEVGPHDNSTWQGAVFGVADGKIAFQGVGAPGQLPHRATLMHPQQGLKLKQAETEFEAWALQNPIDSQTSHYVKVIETPQQLLFGAYPDREEAEVFVVKMVPVGG